MKTLIDSLKSQIKTQAGVDAYFVDVPDAPTYPYVLLWTSGGQLRVNSLSMHRDLGDRLGVTMVDVTDSGNVLLLVPKVRAALVGFTPASDTWTVDEIREPYDSRPVERDRDVSLPGLGYAYYAVDMYDLTGLWKPVTN